MNDLIFKILEVIIYVIVALIARYAIPAIRDYAQHSKYAFLADLIADAVYAVEQQIQGEHMGATRKDIVSEYALKMANKYKIDLTGEQINMLIEAAVKAMNQANPVEE